MEVETLIHPKMMNAAAPDEAPPRRIKTVEIIIFAIFKVCVNLIDSCVFLQGMTLKTFQGSRYSVILIARPGRPDEKRDVFPASSSLIRSGKPHLIRHAA
jgi:hypothetical protein